MGRIVTPRFRVEYVTGSGYRLTPSGWSMPRPTASELAKHCEHLVKSFEPGGCNEHAPVILIGARLVRQSDNVVMATWEA